MGLIGINCPACNKPYLWFTGTMDQRCDECRDAAKKEELSTDAKLKKMTRERESLNYLLVKVQMYMSDMIDLLSPEHRPQFIDRLAEVDRLRRLENLLETK